LTRSRRSGNLDVQHNFFAGRSLIGLLQSFLVLHQRRHEGLRVYAYIYETGHWRCALGVIGEPLNHVNNDFEYSSGAQWEFFNSNSGNANLVDPDLVLASHNDVADLMSEHQPALLERARFSCTPYAVWYQALLEACGPDGCFWMRGNSPSAYDARGAGYVHVERRPGVETRFPLSPIF
jgi:hypothetical protein